MILQIVLSLSLILVLLFLGRWLWRKRTTIENRPLSWAAAISGAILFILGVFYLLAFVVGIILAFWVFGIETQRTTYPPIPSPTQPVPQVFNLSADDVKSIDIRDLRQPREVILTRTENGWQVDKPTQKSANSAKVESTLSKVVSLQASRVLNEVTDVKPYGASLEVRLTLKNSNVYAVTVGNKTPDGSGYYVMNPSNAKQVFIVNTLTLDEFQTLLDSPPYQ